MLSDNTLPHRSQICNIVLLAFNDLPTSLHNQIGDFGSDYNLYGSILLQSNLFSSLQFDQRLNLWLCGLLCEYLFFAHSTEKHSVMSYLFFTNGLFSHSPKYKFILEFQRLISSVHSLHVYGVDYGEDHPNKLAKILNYFHIWTNYSNILNNVEHFLNPIVCYYLNSFITHQELNKMDEFDNLTPNGISPNLGIDKNKNLLVQLIWAHHLLNEAGDPTEFLTLKHIMHILVECFIIGHVAIYKTLGTIFTILALRPKWQLKVKYECQMALKNKFTCDSNVRFVQFIVCYIFKL